MDIHMGLEDCFKQKEIHNDRMPQVDRIFIKISKIIINNHKDTSIPIRAIATSNNQEIYLRASNNQ